MPSFQLVSFLICRWIKKRILRHLLLEKCDDPWSTVCVCKLIRNKATLSKKASHSCILRFWLALAPNQTKPSNLNWLWQTLREGRGAVLSLGSWSHSKVLCPLNACDIFAKSMWQSDDTNSAFMWHQCDINVTLWHPCNERDIFAKSTWRQCDTPSPLNCAAEENLIPLISTLTMLFICTSYTVNFISFKQIYFINICLFACFHFNDINIFFGISLAASLVGGVSSSLGKVDAKMQILLHLKRFTKSRVCIHGDTDSPSRKPRGRTKTPTRQLLLRQRSRMFTSGQFLSGPDFG